ncbi:MAG: hypothetical protein F4X40_07810 [Chloroflexi bacterium]|nr:hypothetical protein [Chloroflexota bacterium]
MTADKNGDFYKLTFSQREGKAPLPEVMKLEYIPQKFRQLVWLCVDGAIRDATDQFRPIYRTRDGIARILWWFRFEIQETPHDEIPSPNPKYDKKFCREIILRGDYHRLLTFVEYILRQDDCSKEVQESLMTEFERTPVAYYVDLIDGTSTIMPRISRETGEATRKAIETIREGNMDGAAAHLRHAAEHINAGQHADSIADSIHAVESVARTIDPKANRTLGPALKSLENSGVLKHPALREAFEKLYGYTSDEQGIRHALLDKDAADAGLVEAVFMFGACASFAAYLTEKHRQTGGA